MMGGQSMVGEGAGKVGKLADSARGGGVVGMFIYAYSIRLCSKCSHRRRMPLLITCLIHAAQEAPSLG